MSYADDPEGWHRLRDAYARMSDKELLLLNNQFDSLTDDAQGLLRNELTRRKLSASSAILPDMAEAPSELSAEDTEEGDAYFPADLLQRGGVALCECDTTDEANFVSFILGEERIASDIRRNEGRSDLRLPQVLVAPDDLEKAKQVLNSANLTELRPRFEAESAITSRDFAPPTCPNCSSEELFLESVEPTNTWVCEDCGTTWQDPPIGPLPAH
ncbi:hypothetical protein HDF16_004535 [Granulicella aggregans]|uniref:Uncharacterized protein n=1 Tax=Granulicella aggregans TaxID=474949 RepID=A0A7W8E5N3_9BACT|nr:TFIIB-type zinc ribbon-containing protein [Granulicella aggregans]MBB5059806.1 hypothetical protein [Granulicella aggregans]